MPKSKKRTFTVIFSVTGRAVATVEAEDEAEARAIANAYDVDGKLLEWEYDDIESIEED